MIHPESLRKLTEQEEAQCSLAEALIDIRLATYWQPGLTVRIAADPTWNRKMIGALIREYQKSGWKVEPLSCRDTGNVVALLFQTA
jgi:hypothetical protein